MGCGASGLEHKQRRRVSINGVERRRRYVRDGPRTARSWGPQAAGAAAREAQVARHVALLAALGWLVGWFVPLADTLRSGTEVTLTVKVIEHLLER